jgi:hypothetical protein
MYGITRLDYKRSGGWWVRLYEGTRCHSKLFSDGNHGGLVSARIAAKAWRDKTLRAINKRGRVRGKPGRVPSLEHPRNVSGVAGVQLNNKKDRRTECQCVVWTAIWFADGRRRSKSFSVRRYGYRGAYLWAAYVRARALDQEIDLRRLVTPPPPANLRPWLEHHDCLRKRVDYSSFRD